MAGEPTPSNPVGKRPTLALRSNSSRFTSCTCLFAGKTRCGEEKVGWKPVFNRSVRMICHQRRRFICVHGMEQLVAFVLWTCKTLTTARPVLDYAWSVVHGYI